jgi:Uncharacterized protein involved in chromosome partitioning
VSEELNKKVDLTDETEDRNEEEIVLEENYQKAIMLIDSIECMVISKQKVEMYQKLINEMREMNGYKDVNEQIKICNDKMKAAKEDLKQKIYKQAKEKKEKAKSVEDYADAVTELKKVSGYLDSDQMITECEKLSIELRTRTSRKSIFKLVIFAFAIVLLFIVFSTSQAKYCYADLNMKLGTYGIAIKSFTKLDDYKDSKQKISECYYLWGKKLSKTTDLTDAINAFGDARDYKDSAKLKRITEQAQMLKGKVGDIVTFGDSKWRILNKTDNQVLLIRKENLAGMAYNDVAGNVTWETSSLRHWLNTNYKQKTFSKEEDSILQLSTLKNNNNAKYGTAGGNDTKDYIYLLSIEEANTYLPLVPNIKINGWLRSPGNHPNTAAFYTAKGVVMDYGYEATNQNILVRPVVSVRFK